MRLSRILTQQVFLFKRGAHTLMELFRLLALSPDVPEFMTLPKEPTFVEAPPCTLAVAAVAPPVVHAPPVRSAASPATAAASEGVQSAQAALTTASGSASEGAAPNAQAPAGSEPSVKKRRVTPMLIQSANTALTAPSNGASS